MGTHSKKNSAMTNAAITYCVAALGGVLVAALVLLLTDIATFGALAIGAVLAVIAAAVLHNTMVNPLPPPNAMDMPSQPVPAAPAPAPAPAPTAEGAPQAGQTAAQAHESAVRPTVPLPGEADLAARKGEWSYAPDAPVDGIKPEGLSAPRDGTADDLKQIKGVGPKLEELLHSMGYYHFDQIAHWTAAEVAWVDENLEGFKGRVTRDEWVAQARGLSGS